MNIKEFGCENEKVIMLLHGGGLSWWSCREAAERLAGKYRVVLPILDGHAGSDEDFSSIEDNAAGVIRYIDEHLGGSVLLIGGLSLGAQILVEMLAQRKDICSFAIVESALALPMKITYHLTGPMMDMSYGLIKRKWFSCLQFRALRLKKELYDEYYRDTCKISKGNMKAFLRANARYEPKSSLADTEAIVCVCVGQKEQRIMRRSAQRLHGMIPGSKMIIMPSLHHGEFSINHADEYAQYICELIENRGEYESKH